MDLPSDQTHIFRFREIHFDSTWRPRMFGSGVAYRLAERGVEGAVSLVADDGTEVSRSYASGQVLVFGDIVHLPRKPEYESGKRTL
ncbi:MAG: hypothetical protein RLN75_07535 [Longimicrobiales bacterium]